MGPRRDEPEGDEPSEVLLVPPPVRPRRMPIGLPPPPPVTPTGSTEPWAAEDAVQAPTPPGAPYGGFGPGATRDSLLFADVAKDEDFSIDERLRGEWLDDPLTISSNDTVPLFGLAPPREADPEHKAPPAEPACPDPQSDTRTAWIIAGLALLASLALAAFLLFTP